MSEQQLKLPLQDTDAEERILAKILVNPNSIGKIADILKPESFYLESNGEIYRAAYTLHCNGKPAYLTTILAWLKSNKLLDKAGGEDKIHNLADSGALINEVQDEAQLVADRHIRRQLTEAANTIAETAHATEKPLEEVVNLCKEQVYHIEPSGSNLKRTKSSPDAVRIARNHLYSDSKIFHTGFCDLDNLLGGFEPGTLTILAGRSSMGKSQAALALCHQIAYLHQIPVIYFSLEMNVVQLEERLWSLISGHTAYKEKKFSIVPSDRFRRHRSGLQPFQDWELDMINEIADMAEKLPIFINDNRAISLQGVWSETRDIIEKHGPVGLVVVDYLQKMSREKQDTNRSYELGRIATGLFDMADDLKVPVVGVCQINRAVEGMTNKRPMMSHLAESGVIEQVADSIIGLYREEYYNPDTPDRGIIEWLSLKARLGQTGVAKMLFDPSCSVFRNMVQKSIA